MNKNLTQNQSKIEPRSFLTRHCDSYVSKVSCCKLSRTYGHWPVCLGGFCPNDVALAELWWWRVLSPLWLLTAEQWLRPRGRPATLTDETALVMGRRVDVGGRGGVRVGLAEFVWRFVEVSKPLPTLPPVPRLSRWIWSSIGIIRGWLQWLF